MVLFRNLIGDIANPFFVEVVQRGEIAASDGSNLPCLNVYNFRRLSNGLPFDPANVVDAVQNAITTPILASTNVRYTLVQWECRALDDPAAATAIQPSGANGDLGDAESAYDACSAVYYLIRTGHRGRSFFGSKHFGAIDEENIDSDELNDTGIALYTTLRTALRGLITSPVVDDDGNAWKPFILSRELSSLGPTDIPAIITGADWATVELNLTIGTMRGRKEGTRRLG